MTLKLARSNLSYCNDNPPQMLAAPLGKEQVAQCRRSLGRKITPRGWMQGARCRTLPGVHERLGPELRSCAIWRGKRVNRGGRCSHSLAFLCMAYYGGAGPLLSAMASIAWIYGCQPGVLLGYVVRCYRAMYVDPRPAMST